MINVAKIGVLSLLIVVFGTLSFAVYQVLVCNTACVTLSVTLSEPATLDGDSLYALFQSRTHRPWYFKIYGIQVGEPQDVLATIVSYERTDDQLIETNHRMGLPQRPNTDETWYFRLEVPPCTQAVSVYFETEFTVIVPFRTPPVRVHPARLPAEPMPELTLDYLGAPQSVTAALAPYVDASLSDTHWAGDNDQVSVNAVLYSPGACPARLPPSWNVNWQSLAGVGPQASDWADWVVDSGTDATLEDKMGGGTNPVTVWAQLTDPLGSRTCSEQWTICPLPGPGVGACTPGVSAPPPAC